MSIKKIALCVILLALLGGFAYFWGCRIYSHYVALDYFKSRNYTEGIYIYNHNLFRVYLTIQKIDRKPDGSIYSLKPNVDIRPLKDLMFVKDIILVDFDISNDEFRQIMNHPGVESIELHAFPVDDEAFRDFYRLRRLKYLRVTDFPKITSKILNYISPCKELEVLILGNVTFHKDDFEPLKSLENLCYLVLDACHFDSEETIDHLFDCTSHVKGNISYKFVNFTTSHERVLQHTDSLKKISGIRFTNCDRIDDVILNAGTLPDDFFLTFDCVALNDQLIEKFPVILNGILSLEEVNVTPSGIRSFLEHQIELRKERNEFCPLPEIRCRKCEFINDEKLKQVIDEMEENYVRVIEDNKQ